MCFTAPTTLDVSRQATLKGSTMDPIALREFLHVLSLEYSSGTKGARILASLPSSNTAATTHGEAASRTEETG